MTVNPRGLLVHQWFREDSRYMYIYKSKVPMLGGLHNA